MRLLATGDAGRLYTGDLFTKVVTLRTYTHLVPSSHERARQAIDAVFGRPVAADGLEAA